MIRTCRLAALLALPLLTAFLVQTSSWRLAPNYTIRFSGQKAEGTFSGLKGTVVYDPADPAKAVLDVTVDAATIETGNSLKNKHARSENWLDAARFPTIRFKSTTFRPTGDGYLVQGNLTLHGVTKPVAIPFHFTTQAAEKGLFTGSFTVNRHDYRIEGNFLGFSVGDEFKIELRVPVMR